MTNIIPFIDDCILIDMDSLVYIIYGSMHYLPWGYTGEDRGIILSFEHKTYPKGGEFNPLNSLENQILT